MTVGSVCAGLGGFDLAASQVWGFPAVRWQIEIDPFCRRVLAKHWPDARRYEDLREVAPDELEPVQLICGGVPCQPFSAAGERRGCEDDRHLWPAMFALVAAIRPAWVVVENTPLFVRMALDGAAADLESIGYAVGAACIPACAVNAPHKRERMWLIAHTDRQHGGGQPQRPGSAGARAWSEPQRSPAAAVSHTAGVGCGPRRAGGPSGDLEGPAQLAHGLAPQPGSPRLEGHERRELADPREWRSYADAMRSSGRLHAPVLCRVDDGLPHRVDRIRALGNAIVPAVAEQLFRWLDQAERSTA